MFQIHPGFILRFSLKILYRNSMQCYLSYPFHDWLNQPSSSDEVFFSRTVHIIMTLSIRLYIFSSCPTGNLDCISSAYFHVRLSGGVFSSFCLCKAWNFFCIKQSLLFFPQKFKNMG